MPDAPPLPRSLDDPAATQAWIAGLGSAAIDRQLAGYGALWRALLDDGHPPSARWAGMLRFWPATADVLDRATTHLAERPLPMGAATWAHLESAGGILTAMGQLAVRCLVEERDALFLGLDAQSRRLRMRMMLRAEVPDEDWLDLLRMARLAQARGVLDRHGPMIDPRLPSARALIARPLLLRAADPFAMPTPTLVLVDRIAARLARRIGLRIEGPGPVLDNPLGATLTFGRAGTAMLDGRGLRDHLERVVDDESRTADRRSGISPGAGEPGHEPRRALPSTGWPGLAERLSACWSLPALADDVARARRQPQHDPVQAMTRARLRAGPLMASVVPTVAATLAVEPVGGATIAGRGGATTMAGPGTVAGMPTALAIEYVYGRGDVDPIGRAAMQAERRQRREQYVIEQLMAQADLCFVPAIDDASMTIDRSAPDALRLGGLLAVALGDKGAQRLVLGRLESCRHQPPPGPGLPPVQRLGLVTWPGEARVVGLQIIGDAWQTEAYYIPGVPGERAPSVVVGRGRCRPGEVAALRLSETDLQVRFGEVLDEGPDFTRLAVSLVRG